MKVVLRFVLTGVDLATLTAGLVPAAGVFPPAGIFPSLGGNVNVFLEGGAASVLSHTLDEWVHLVTTTAALEGSALEGRGGTGLDKVE